MLNKLLRTAIVAGLVGCADTIYTAHSYSPSYAPLNQETVEESVIQRFSSLLGKYCHPGSFDSKGIYCLSHEQSSVLDSPWEEIAEVHGSCPLSNSNCTVYISKKYGELEFILGINRADVQELSDLLLTLKKHFQDGGKQK